MNRKQKMYSTVISLAAVFLAVAFVTADSSLLSTPLYTFRMEKVSSDMNFLPTEVNTFTYTAEKGYTLEYSVANCCSAGIQSTSSQYTCYGYVTCEGSYTCSQTCAGFTHGGYTCLPTCYNWWTCTPFTCVYSCGNYTCVAVFTCMGTCVQTCPETCDTCQGQGWTCNATGCQRTCSTCDDPTCPVTCEDTCIDTCWETCIGPQCPVK